VIKVDHKGHAIEYDEAAETWTCPTFGLSDKSLVKLRKMVAREDKKMRTMRVPALYVTSAWNSKPRVRDAVITLLREKHKVNAEITNEPDDDGTRLVDQYNVELHDLFPIDQRDNIAAYAALRKAAEEATARADNAWHAIEATHLTPERLREMVVAQAEAET
jgi:hypothetical protein